MAVSRFVHALSLHFNTLRWSTRVRLGYPWTILAVGVFGGLLRDGLLCHFWPIWPVLWAIGPDLAGV
jgi:hypothetical protein